MGSYFRSPKTGRERRQYYKEGSEYVRCARRPLHIPDAWWDLDRDFQRCWKRQSRKRKQHGYDQPKIRSLKRKQ